MTAYLTFDVLEIEPNSRDQSPDGFTRSFVRLDPGLGEVSVDDQGGTPIMSHSFSWFLDGRTNIDAFRTFIAARRGKAVPFWLPSWRQDLVLNTDLLSSDTVFLINFTGYTKFLFQSNARRYVVFLMPNGTKIYRKITAALDMLDGTERITIDSSPGVAVTASTTMVSFLDRKSTV